MGSAAQRLRTWVLLLRGLELGFRLFVMVGAWNLGSVSSLRLGLGTWVPPWCTVLCVLQCMTSLRTWVLSRVLRALGDLELGFRLAMYDETKNLGSVSYTLVLRI